MRVSFVLVFCIIAVQSRDTKPRRDVSELLSHSSQHDESNDGYNQLNTQSGPIYTDQRGVFNAPSGGQSISQQDTQEDQQVSAYNQNTNIGDVQNTGYQNYNDQSNIQQEIQSDNGPQPNTFSQFVPQQNIDNYNSPLLNQNFNTHSIVQQEIQEVHPDTVPAVYGGTSNIRIQPYSGPQQSIDTVANYNQNTGAAINEYSGQNFQNLPGRVNGAIDNTEIKSIGVSSGYDYPRPDQ